MSAARDPGSMRTATAVLRVLGDHRDQRTSGSIAVGLGLDADIVAGALRSLRHHGLAQSVDQLSSDYVLWWATPLGEYCRDLLRAPYDVPPVRYLGPPS